MENDKEIEEQIKECGELNFSQITKYFIGELKGKFPDQSKARLTKLFKTALFSYCVIEEIEGQINFFITNKIEGE